MQLHNDYKDSGLVVVGIAVDPVDAEARARSFVTDYSVPYRILVDDGKVSVAYGVVSRVPVNVAIDKEGWIAYHITGPLYEDDINKIIGLVRE